MIKAIFFDIDGTILDGENGVPKSTIEALDLLKQKGIKRVIATGRDMGEVKPTGLLDYGFDGYITLNGQLCFDENLNLFYGHPLNKEDKETLIKLFNSKEYPCGLCLEKGTILNYIDDNVRNIHQRLNCSIPPIGEYKGEEIYQAIAYPNEKQENDLANSLKDCLITSWNIKAVDVIGKDGGKDKGILEYIRHIGINISETMAFGDGHNDASMIKCVNIGVAMGNAVSDLKEVSDYIAENIDKDGVYKALKQFEII